MTEVIRYIIDLEPGQVETAAELLTDAGIRFDPVKNMIAMAWDNVEENIFTGRDGEWLPQIINVYLSDTGDLDDDGDPGSVIQPFHEMTLLAQRDLLMLATLHCDWHEREIQEMNQEAWETFQKQHPEAVSPMPKA